MRGLRICCAAVIFWLIFPACAHALNLERLPASDVRKVQGILARLEPLIKLREAEGTLATLTFDELYRPLSKQERRFLRRFEKLSARKLNVKIPFRGMARGREELVKITGQKILMNGAPFELPAQFLPPRVYERYLAMMAAMEKDLGKRLYVESGYRSSAYQLYLFVFYLQNHEYSIRETVKWVALPGFSEHGSPAHQAIDFINRDGISGETDPAQFENLPEYEWLLARAREFGFVLSYPKRSGFTFEPWHWRYEAKSRP